MDPDLNKHPYKVQPTRRENILPFQPPPVFSPPSPLQPAPDRRCAPAPEPEAVFTSSHIILDKPGSHGHHQGRYGPEDALRGRLEETEGQHFHELDAYLKTTGHGGLHLDVLTVMTRPQTGSHPPPSPVSNSSHLMVPKRSRKSSISSSGSQFRSRSNPTRTFRAASDLQVVFYAFFRHSLAQPPHLDNVYIEVAHLLQENHTSRVPVIFLPADWLDPSPAVKAERPLLTFAVQDEFLDLGTLLLCLSPPDLGLTRPPQRHTTSTSSQPAIPLIRQLGGPAMPMTGKSTSTSLEHLWNSSLSTSSDNSLGAGQEGRSASSVRIFAASSSIKSSPWSAEVAASGLELVELHPLLAAEQGVGGTWHTKAEVNYN
ncbi:hypothetical protein JCM11251_000472 [Rhodosporidiobolus azoricus]